MRTPRKSSATSTRPCSKPRTSRSRTERNARLHAFYEPEVNSDGDLKCGIDVRMDDGSYLEITVSHTGWENLSWTPEAQRAHRRRIGRQP